MDIPIYQIDAFADAVFKGNPAAVCPLERWLADEVMQDIAAENNLSETAFFKPRDDDGAGAYDLRWFTPVSEIDLAGHPTLATSFLIFTRLDPSLDRIRFYTKIGDVLEIAREDGLIVMNFPARPPAPRPGLGDVAAALKAEPTIVLAARDGFAVFDSEEEILGLSPDMDKVAKLDCLGLVATAPGKDCDFVSRFFAPGQGIPEDPVTGSAHCTLVPYWAERTGKDKLHARQLSKRGGELFCENLGGRVKIAGRAVLFMEGTIRL